jgi:tetratricopeptide (TPR) repeat protein
MKCIDPKMKKLVGLYQFNLLGEEEKLSVEDHLLECDACFEEVYRLSSAMEIVQEKSEFFLDALEPKVTYAMRISNLFKKTFHGLSDFMNGILSTMDEWWRKPAIRIMVPVTVIAILILIFVTPIKKNFSDLAIIENASYLALKVRGFADEFSSTQNLYNQGMKYYQEKNYEQAIQKLTIFVKRKKDEPYGHFYLGVSYLLTDEYKKGIKHLKLASELCEKQGKAILLEKCHWYLGNAYLKTNDVDNALKEFRRVVAIGGDFREDANKQIVRIEKMKGK